MSLTQDEKLDLYEQAIPVLDDLWNLAEPCVLPDDIGAELGFKPGQPVPNKTYDMWRIELKAARPDLKMFHTADAGTAESTERKFAHNPPLTSIAKASHEDKGVQADQLIDFLEKVIAAAPASIRNGPSHTVTINDKDVRYPKDYLYQEFKLDGLAVALYYENGKLVRAGLRPRDGINGEDVTEQVKYVNGIPQELKLPLTCSVRGEIICLIPDFAQVQEERKAAGEDLRANPRNHAAGGIRQFKDPTKVKQQRLSFVAYSVVGIDNPPWKTEIERAKFCNQKLGVPYVQARPFNFDQLAEMEEKAKTLPYETDGIIIGVNDLEVSAQMGHHGDRPTGDPKGKIAWKFAEEEATPAVLEIPWYTGRSGSLTPLSIFDPVPLAGTIVRRATLHNLGYVIRNKIGVGTVIRVLKAGKIIPKVVGVVANPITGNADYPKVCPSCGKPTKVFKTPGKAGEEDMYDLVCENHDACPAQRVGNLQHYLTILGVLGLGESRITQLYEGGKLKTYADFYELTEKDCMDAGLSERQALLALAAIHLIQSPDKVKENDKLREKVRKAAGQKKVFPIWKIFASFGIDTAGRAAGKALQDHFGTLEAIRTAGLEGLRDVPDVGDKTAQIVADYFDANKADIDRLLKYVEPEEIKTGPLTGVCFVLSGSFPGGKSTWEKKIEALGGKTSGSVSKSKTNFLVEGPDAGDKVAKAKGYGIPVIDLDTLKRDHLKE